MKFMNNFVKGILTLGFFLAITACYQSEGNSEGPRTQKNRLQYRGWGACAVLTDTVTGREYLIVSTGHAQGGVAVIEILPKEDK